MLKLFVIWSIDWVFFTFISSVKLFIWLVHLSIKINEKNQYFNFSQLPKTQYLLIYFCSLEYFGTLKSSYRFYVVEDRRPHLNPINDVRNYRGRKYSYKRLRSFFFFKIKKYSVLTSESAPLSAPGHVNVTYSWHLLCTTKLHTATE